MRILQAIAVRFCYSYSVPQSNPDKEATRKRLEAFVQEARASETVARAIAQVQQRQKEGFMHTQTLGTYAYTIGP